MKKFLTLWLSLLLVLSISLIAHAQTVTLEEVEDDVVTDPSPVEIVLTPEEPTVGTTTELNMTFKDPATGVLYDRALVVLQIDHGEMGVPIFKTTFHSLHGNIVFDYGFMDAGTYRLEARVSPTEFTVNTFAPFIHETLITVGEGPSSTGALVKLIILVGFMLLFGHLAARRQSRKSK
jgi:uncharacterized membrane protein